MGDIAPLVPLICDVLSMVSFHLSELTEQRPHPRFPEVSASYRHVSLKILNEFPKVLDNVSLELGKQKDQFRISSESKVDNPLGTIESFNKQFQLGEKERDAVEWGWNQEAGNTMFNVVGAYTRAAQFDALPAEASYRLQKVGGAILGMVK